MLQRPKSHEIPDSQRTYIDKCPDDILLFLNNQAKEFSNLINNLTEDQLNYSYGEGKWTLREVVMHILDTEQIFAYRALAIHRGDRQNLPGFDQDEYMANTNYQHLDKNHMHHLFTALRDSTLLFFSSIEDNEWNKSGKISDYTMSLNAMPYMIGGHLEHHRRIIMERYIQ